MIVNKSKAKSTFGGSVNINENRLNPISSNRKMFGNTPNVKFGLGPTAMAMQFN